MIFLITNWQWGRGDGGSLSIDQEVGWSFFAWSSRGSFFWKFRDSPNYCVRPRSLFSCWWHKQFKNPNGDQGQLQEYLHEKSYNVAGLPNDGLTHDLFLV